MIRRAIPLLAALVSFSMWWLSPVAGLAATPVTPKVLACSGKAVIKPTTFVISCADGNSGLSATHWRSWASTSAKGTTTFGLNPCTPYCAASPIAYYEGATVTLSAPVSTKHGVLFSKLVVAYKQKGAAKTFTFSWKGSAGF